MSIRNFSRFAAWAGLALIILVTISPIQARPPDITTTDLDRGIAFFVMSGLFVIAYPRRPIVMTILLFCAAFLIELMQFASVTRHPQLHDAVIKAVGVLLGVSAGLLVNLMRRRKTAEADSSTL